MKIITDRDLDVVCDSGKCTAPAVYACNIHSQELVVRLYCPRHTAELLQGMVELVKDNLHQYVEVEHIVTGAALNA